MKHIIIKGSLSAVALLTAFPCWSAKKTDKRPNILLIMADDMGYSDIGCYGGEIPTPNIDALAARGLRFTQFYNCGRSCPTRASLLTGLYSHQAGIGAMSEDPELKDGDDPEHQGEHGYMGFLNRNCLTMAEVLRDAGYHTYMTGKWHVGLHGKEKWPLQRGLMPSPTTPSLSSKSSRTTSPSSSTLPTTPRTGLCKPRMPTSRRWLGAMLMDGKRRASSAGREWWSWDS